MRRHYPENRLCCKTIALVVGVCLISASAGAGEPRASERAPRINVVFLDDGADGLPGGMEMRRNCWSEWDARIPTFRRSLVTLVADFSAATTDQPEARSSLYALELLAVAKPERKDALIAHELEQISKVTGRPSAILARSTVGGDQLRLVFQDAHDYQPLQAARFLRVLAEISPLVFHRRIAERFGPFQPPPTIIFDPRVTSLADQVSSGDKAKHRWALLEGETYLLPHYVLHAVATLDRGVGEKTGTYYADSRPELGTMTLKRSDLYIAASGINSPADPRESGLLNLAEAHAARDPLVVHVDIADWKRRGNDFDDPKTVNALRVFASMHTQTAKAQGRDIIFDVAPDLKPYQPVGKDTPDYFGDRHRWDREAAYQAMATDALSRGYRDANSEGTTHYLSHSEGVYSFTRTTFNFDNVELYKGRVGRDELVPRVKEIIAHGGDVALFTGKGDYWSLVNVATKSTAFDIARETGATAYHDRSWNGHHINLDPTSYDVYSPKFGRLADIRLDPKTIGAGSFADPCGCAAISTGGVLFNKDNCYVLDLTGRVYEEGRSALDRLSAPCDAPAAAAPLGMGVAAISMTARRKAFLDDLVILCIDAAGRQHECLPFAVPRCLARAEDAATFGGPWSFEALTMALCPGTGFDRPLGPPREILVSPAETAVPLRYVLIRPADATVPSPPLYFVKDGSRFQPPLDIGRDGRYTWTLRHGVQVEFDTEGRVQAIRSPTGEAVMYLREGGLLVGLRGFGQHQIDICYRDGRPKELLVDGEKQTAYEYGDDRLAKVCWKAAAQLIQYDANALPCQLSAPGLSLALQHDAAKRVTSITTQAVSISIEYVPQSNAIHTSITGQPPEHWRFGPVTGRIASDRAVVWTRSAEGRILQMALGTIQPTSQGNRFIPHESIGAKALPTSE